MNKKTLLTTLSSLFLSGFMCTYSQTTYSKSNYGETNSSENSESYSSENKSSSAYKTTFVKNRFKDTWFVSIGSGVQMILAEDDDKAKYSSRVTYAPTFSIGKYFSPIWGLRLQFTGGSLHGFNDGVGGTYRKWNNGTKDYMGGDLIGKPGYPTEIPGIQTWDPQWNRLGFTINNDNYDKRITFDENANTYNWYQGKVNNELYMRHTRYIASNLNFMFDFLTLIGDYDPQRFFEITPFGGIGVAHLFPHYTENAYNVFGVNAGLNAKIRLSNKIDFNLEYANTFYPDEFDGQMGGRTASDLVSQATAGFTYKIGKSSWDVATPMNYNMIQDLNYKINDLKSQLQESQKPCPDCPACPAAPLAATDNQGNYVDGSQANTTAIKFLPDPVLFRIDKSTIDAGEWTKIEKAVDYLQKYPTANVVITGYADKKTGYPAHNMRLSERRAKAVSAVLVEKYGINPMRLSIKWKGDSIQPFEINAWNRVVVFVIE